MGKILVGVGTVNWGVEPPSPPIIPTLNSHPRMRSLCRKRRGDVADAVKVDSCSELLQCIETVKKGETGRGGYC